MNSIRKYSDAYDFGTLLKHGEKCCNGGRWKPSTQSFELKILQHTHAAATAMQQNNHNPEKTISFKICERGKVRNIEAHKIVDRQVYRSLCREVIIPNTSSMIVRSNTASQEGKGTQDSLKLFRKHLAHAFKVCKGNDFYIFTFDFHDYFRSIPHEKIFEVLGSRLDFESELELRKYVGIFDKGIGIGGEPSQIIAIFFASKLDWTLSCYPNCLGYGRYMDDGYVIVQGKDSVKEICALFEETVADLGLVVNTKHTDVFWMKKDWVTFLKKRTHVTATGKIIQKLTRKNIRDEIRRLKYQKKMFDAGRMPIESIEQSMAAWLSYAKGYDSYYSIHHVVESYAQLFEVSMRYVWNLTSKKKKRAA